MFFLLFFEFSPLPGQMIQFDLRIFLTKWVGEKTPPRFCWGAKKYTYIEHHQVVHFGVVAIFWAFQLGSRVQNMKNPNVSTVLLLFFFPDAPCMVHLPTFTIFYH